MKNIATDIIGIQKKLQKTLDERRFLHTLGVAYTATSMAMVHDCDIKKAQLAGLLHDCAKMCSKDKLLKTCKKNGIKITTHEQEHPEMLHAKIGALIARSKYHITDSEVLDAIRWHTTGKSAMSKLGKIIYIADFIEPNRKELDCLDKIRELAFSDLDECMYVLLKNIIEFLESKNEEIDEVSNAAFEYYSNLHNQGRIKG